jgi:hypothetical protein
MTWKVGSPRWIIIILLYIVDELDGTPLRVKLRTTYKSKRLMLETFPKMKRTLRKLNHDFSLRARDAMLGVVLAKDDYEDKEDTDNDRTERASENRVRVHK